MNAVLLAGGEGSRLKPISAERPKPMVRLFDKPIMEYGLELLKSHGFTEVTATLQTLPHKITDYFGDGSAYGVRLDYHIELTPLGTAGGVRACRDRLSGGPFLVISGDAVTDIDLSAAMRFHREKSADVTIVLVRQEDPTEYGLVLTDENGKIRSFIEKPSPGQVFTDLVNTGIYIISPHVLDMIPENSFFDFSRDLFPLMLTRGMNLCGYNAGGYWCDMGSPDAYMRCCCDILDQQVKLALNAQLAPLPDNCHITAPCFIAEDVLLEPGCRIGPYCVIGSGSTVARGAVVDCSVIDGAHVGESAQCLGCFVGRGSVVREGAVVHEGAVVGEGVLIGSYAELTGDARIWPNKELLSGLKISGSVTSGSVRKAAAFIGGTLEGDAHASFSPEFCLRLGMAAAGLFGGEIAVSWQGGDAARVAALALETGLCSAGAQAVLTDALFSQSASYAARLYRFPLSIFVEERSGKLTFHFFDSNGLLIDRETERRLEAETARGETPQGRRAARSRKLGGVAGVYAAAAAVPPEWFLPGSSCSVRVTGGDAQTGALRSALEISGCSIRFGSNTPVFSLNGGVLSVIDETGAALSHGQLLGILIYLEAAGGERKLALPYAAPAFLDEWANSLGLDILRLGRDGERARELHSAQRFLYDGVFSSVRLSYGIRTHSLSLNKLSRKVPSFHQTVAEIRLDGDQGSVMRALAESQTEAELVDGIRARVGKGWVHVSPLPGKRALRITAEGATEEIAGELCDLFSTNAKKMDRQID